MMLDVEQSFNNVMYLIYWKYVVYFVDTWKIIKK